MKVENNILMNILHLLDTIHQEIKVDSNISFSITHAIDRTPILLIIITARTKENPISLRKAFSVENLFNTKLDCEEIIYNLCKEYNILYRRNTND